MTRPRSNLPRLTFFLVLSAPTFDAHAGEIEIIEGIPPGFELVRLTDDPTMEHSVPDINDAGEVVFGKFVSADALGNLFRFSGGLVGQLTDEATYDLNIVTNNFSQIAWITCVNSGGPFRVVTDYAAGPIDEDNFPVSGIDMNDQGDIVWYHRPQVGVSEFDIYLYTHADGNVTQLTDGGDNQSARLNNEGQVLWRVKDASVNPWIGRIMLYSDGEVFPITPEDGQAHSPDINDLGHVVYRDGLANAVFLWNGVDTMEIASAAFTPRINNKDEIALALWDFEDNLAKHAIFKDAIIYVLPNFGLTTNRSSLNNRSEMAMRFRDVSSGHKDLFLLRWDGPKGDGNYDCRIDKTDFQLLQLCRTALPGPEGSLLADCIRFDFDDDGDVDLVDYGVFLESYTGPGGSVPDCEP